MCEPVLIRKYTVGNKAMELTYVRKESRLILDSLNYPPFTDNSHLRCETIIKKSGEQAAPVTHSRACASLEHL